MNKSLSEQKLELEIYNVYVDCAFPKFQVQDKEGWDLKLTFVCIDGTNVGHYGGGVNQIHR